MLGATKRENIQRVLEFYGMAEHVVTKESPDVFTRLMDKVISFFREKAVNAIRLPDNDAMDARRELQTTKNRKSNNRNSTTESPVEVLTEDTESTDSDSKNNKNGTVAENETTIAKSRIIFLENEENNINRNDDNNDTVVQPLIINNSDHVMETNFSPDSVLPYLFLSRKNKATRAGVLEIDPTVMQIDVNTSLFKVHFLFTMLGLGQLFVTNRGKLVGVITRTQLIKYLKEAQQ